MDQLLSVSALISSLPPELLRKERGQRNDAVIFTANQIDRIPIRVGRLAFTPTELRQFFLFCKDIFLKIKKLAIFVGNKIHPKKT